MKLSIIIPVFNEEGSLRELYYQINGSIKTFKEYEIVFIDDGSSDESKTIIQSIIEKDPKVKLISFFRNFGKSAALSEGFKYASGDIIITMDADLQDDPNEIPALISKLNEGYDLVSD